MAESPSEPKAKRQKVDKMGRFAAFEKLKNLKGKKNKLEVNDEVDNVYEIVDEKDYAKKANEMYGNDWIEDDGTGYLEDGRDFFEDEDYSDGDDNSKKSNKRSKRLRDDKPTKAKGSIRNLFSNAAPRKQKEGNVKLEEDDVLAGILGELDDKQSLNGESSTLSSTIGGSQTKKRSTKNEAVIVKEYMQNFMSNMKKKESTKEKEDSDDEMIDRILKPKNLKQKAPQIVSVEVLKTASVPPKVNENIEKVEHVSDLPKIENHFDDNMDFSILNEEENQFESNAKVEIQEEPKDSINITSTELDEENMKNLLNNWENICNMDDNFNEEVAAKSTAGSANNDDDPKLSNENLKIWYWDAWEDMNKRPGEVFLFGKLPGEKNDHKSVCVRIENVEKCLFFLPREYKLDPITKEPTKEKVKLTDVYKEFETEISNEIGLKKFRSRKVTKHFAFQTPGVDIPETCDYMEVRYDGKYPGPNIKTKYNTISHIFGANTSALETFLLDRKIKGPCWLNISDFATNDAPLSWCKVEVTCPSVNSIQLSDEKNINPPPISVLSLNVRTALNPKTHKNEVCMISCLVNNRFAIDKPSPNPPFNRHFCGFTRPISQNWPLDLQQKLSKYNSTKTTKLDTERALLSWFLATYQNIDPDLIVTHDAHDCQLDVICDRIAAIKIPMWSRIGRLRMSQIFGKKFKDFFVGRMVCDVKQSAEELIKSRSYDLDTLCTNILKIRENERMDISNDDLMDMYETGDGILKLITLTMQDCSYILRLMCEFNVMPLALQITNICGNLISRTLQGGRSERNEFLLLHAFNEKNYIVPDKKKREVNWDQNADGVPNLTQGAPTAAAGRKKAAYSGGLVLDPIKGFYDKFILLMDFNSLYPSIIQEYNICFTTIPVPESDNDMPPLPDPNIEQGILPRQIRRLVESRREVKKLMASPDLDKDLKMQYNIRQLALKLTANSMYGCLGFAFSRFFAQHLAALVTFKGREILTNTKSLVQKLNYEVIYGDTDSIMINTNITDYEQVFKIGSTIKQAVNKIYKQVELDVDGVFKYLLLLKKKKYAAVTVNKTSKGEIIYVQEHKGLDIVRRDWSQISVMAGKIVLNEILSDNQLDEKIDNIHAHLEKFKANILDGLVPMSLLSITKQLTKNPKDYTNTITLPHVQVAIRMNATRNKRYKKGDMVNYIICDDGTANPPMQRAYHCDEIKANDKLKIDTQYYLAQQIHPVVSRMCEPLEGTDAGRIAGCLGLDPSKFKAAAQKAHNDRLEDGQTAGESLTKTYLQKFRQCDKFKFTCVICKTENIVASAFKPSNKTYIGVLQDCSNSECNAHPYQYIISIRNQMILSIRSFIGRFYQNWLVCDEPSCNNNTRNFSHVLISNRPVCLVCKQGTLVRQYSERDLYNQLCYFQYIFDLTKHNYKNVTHTPEVDLSYNTLKETVDQVLEKSAYCTIRLSKIFANFKTFDTTNEIIDRKDL